MNAADSLLSVARKYMNYYYIRIIYKYTVAYDYDNKCIFFFNIEYCQFKCSISIFNSYNIITTNNMRWALL